MFLLWSQFLSVFYNFDGILKMTVYILHKILTRNSNLFTYLRQNILIIRAQTNVSSVQCEARGNPVIAGAPSNKAIFYHFAIHKIVRFCCVF